MTPKWFLAVASATLTTLGVLGISRKLGSISRAAFFHPPYWINWAHLSLGVVVTVVRLVGSHKAQATMTLVAAVAGATLGGLGLLLGRPAARRFHIPELADPSDHIAHLTVGLLATWGWLRRNRAEP
jgi:hypothetical protein